MLAMYSPAQQKYLLEIFKQHQQGNTNPGAILKALLTQYNPQQLGYKNPSDHKTAKNLFANHVSLFIKPGVLHNQYLSGKLMALLEHPDHCDHVLSVIYRLNQNQASVQGALVDEELIALLSAFFSVYDNYAISLSDQLREILPIKNYWQHQLDLDADAMIDRLKDEIADNMMDVVNSGESVTPKITKLLSQTHRFGSGTTQNTMIDMALLGLSQSLTERIISLQILNNLKESLSKKTKQCYINALVDMLFISANFKAPIQANENGHVYLMTLISNYLSEFHQSISPKKRHNFITQLIKNTNHHNLERQGQSIEALTYLKNFVSDVQIKTLVPSLINKLEKKFSYEDNIIYVPIILTTLCEYQEVITDIDQLEALGTALLGYLTDHYSVIIEKNACKGLLKFNAVLPEKTVTACINRLIDKLGTKNLFGESASETFCSTLGKLRNRIPADKFSTLIDKLFSIIEKERYFDGGGNAAFTLLEQLRDKMSLNQQKCFEVLLQVTRELINTEAFDLTNFAIFTTANAFFYQEQMTHAEKFVKRLLKEDRKLIAISNNELRVISSVMNFLSKETLLHLCNQLLDKLILSDSNNSIIFYTPFIKFLGDATKGLSFDDQTTLLVKLANANGQSVEIKELFHKIYQQHQNSLQTYALSLKIGYDAANEIGAYTCHRR